MDLEGLLRDLHHHSEALLDRHGDAGQVAAVGRTVSVAGDRTPSVEHGAVLGHEPPFVAGRVQNELQHTMGVADAALAVAQRDSRPFAGWTGSPDNAVGAGAVSTPTDGVVCI